MLATVRLTWHEVRHAAYVGIDRHIHAAKNGRPPAGGIDVDDFGAHVLGCWGELVVAKHYGIYWPGDLGAPDRGTGDVGRMHIRCGEHLGDSLIVRNGDVDDEPFVLVVKQALPIFVIAGWCMGVDAKQVAYTRAPNNRPAAYFVPQRDLITTEVPDIYHRRT